MPRSSILLRTAVAAALLASAALAQAQTLTDYPTPPAGATLLTTLVGPHGEVAYDIPQSPSAWSYVGTGAGHPTGDGGYMPGFSQVLSNDRYIATGANGVGSFNIANLLTSAPMEVGGTGCAGPGIPCVDDNTVHYLAPTTTGSSIFSGGSSGLASIVSIAGVNGTNVAANVSFDGGWQYDYNNQQYMKGSPATLMGVVRTAGGAVSYTGANTQILMGPNASGGVVFGTYDANGNQLATYLLPAGSGSSTTGALPAGAIQLVNSAGMGNDPGNLQVNALNDSGVVAGTMTNGSGNPAAFRSGVQGAVTGTTIFNTTAGWATQGLALNNAGQVGGFIQTATQLVPFLSSAHGSLLVGLGGTTLGTDSAGTIFVNALGNAIVEDYTSGLYYYYSAGRLTPVDSFGTGVNANRYTDPVVGFSDTNTIYLGDPQALDVPSYTDEELAALPGSMDITQSENYTLVVSLEGNVAPSAGFFHTPPQSVDEANIPTDTPPDASVPEPLSLGLFGVSLLGLAARRRRRAEGGTETVATKGDVGGYDGAALPAR